VIYQKGMCHFQQVRSKDREQVHSLKAKGEFERLINRFRSMSMPTGPGRIFASVSSTSQNMKSTWGTSTSRRVLSGSPRQIHYAIENYPDLGQYHEALESIAKCKQKLAAGAPGTSPGKELVLLYLEMISSTV